MMIPVETKMLFYLTFLYLNVICFCGANDILGCGGYVKSDVEINFSQVGIKLYTAEGNLKYETDCAPNNGYYFIPLYDKGSYILKVAPPSGWSFEPEEVALKVDGETDKCFLGHDINFHFEGFAVVGKVVSVGSTMGPTGVKVSLLREGSVVMSTVTGDGGAYVFTPLASAAYTVVASHPTWKFIQDKVNVAVTDENGDAGNFLIVDGYTLSGEVTTDGKPTSKVHFILHTAHDTKPSGCNGGGPGGYKGSSSVLGEAVCFVVSDATGKFSIPSLPPATYTLVPFFQSEATKYEVVPSQLQFNIDHNDLLLNQVFKVEGFSIHGIVVMSESGPSLEGATVRLDNSLTTTTDNNGIFVFHSIKSGTHKVDVIADGMRFATTSVKVTADNPIVSALYPSHYQVCFIVALDKTTNISGPWNIKVINENDKEKHDVVTDAEGRGCLLLLPGSYTSSVLLSHKADIAGIRFGPSEYLFTVTPEPLKDLLFSQFLGEISGTINCLEKCPDLSVSLKPIQRSSSSPRSTTSVKGHFLFKEVVPGSYQVTVHKEEWCWKQKTVDFTVNTKDVEVSLQQVGYRLALAASHQTLLKYSTASGKTGTLEIQKGTTKECISTPGVYTFTPQGCHKFGSAPIRWDTKAPSLVTLAATHHQLTGAIESKEPAPFTVTMKGSNGQVTDLGKLTESKDKKNLYNFDYWVREGETITITPKSSDNLYQYSPHFYTVTMPSDCVKNAVIFKAERALFIKGKVFPGIDGVTIKVTGGDDDLTFLTDTKGEFTAGPLDNSIEYTVTSEKKGYMMKPLSDKGEFEAYKLAEILVDVRDDTGEPLPGVLVSTSGGKSYRQNSLTESDGTISFQSLMPSDYFLRPIMKEFIFDPPSKMVSVEEGATIAVTISGARVAYSVFGSTVSLSGEAEVDVTVEVVGVGPNCGQYQEESVSDANGNFRIRGLMPKCEYDLRLKDGKGVNQHVERTLPASRRIKTDHKDIRSLKLTVLRPFPQMDVAAIVDTDPQFLSSLVAKLYRHDLPDSPVHTVKLGLHPFFMLPPMIADRRSYFLRINSNLPTSQYYYSSSEVNFVADSPYKHLNLSFKPTLRSIDAEMSQGTVIGFALAIILVAFAFNYDKIGPMVDRLSDIYINMKTSKSPSHTPLDSPLIEPINNKKKVRSRKI